MKAQPTSSDVAYQSDLRAGVASPSRPIYGELGTLATLSDVSAIVLRREVPL
jgi:hypothetical protein